MSSSGINLKHPGVRRLMGELRELSLQPDPDFVAGPINDSDLFTWHFSIRGPPDSPFAGGIYHGKILFTPDYPLQPPDVVFLTPNGRFKTNMKICLNTTSYHKESWQASWGVRTLLTALGPFFLTKAEGAVGGIDSSDEERAKLAASSRHFSCSECSYQLPVLPEFENEDTNENENVNVHENLNENEIETIKNHHHSEEDHHEIENNNESYNEHQTENEEKDIINEDQNISEQNHNEMIFEQENENIQNNLDQKISETNEGKAQNNNNFDQKHEFNNLEGENDNNFNQNKSIDQNNEEEEDIEENETSEENIIHSNSSDHVFDWDSFNDNLNDEEQLSSPPQKFYPQYDLPIIALVVIILLLITDLVFHWTGL